MSQYEYNRIVNVNNFLKDELQNYKKLYLKEKKKSEKYKSKINEEEINDSSDSNFSDNYEKNINNLDNSFFEETSIEKEDGFIKQNGAPRVKQLTRNNDEKDEYEELKDFIINKGNDESMKGIKSNDLFKKTKILNSLKKEKDENHINNLYFNQYKNKYNDFKENSSYNLTKTNNNVYQNQNNKYINSENSNIDNYIEENHKTIDIIIKGTVFEMLDLNYNELRLNKNNDTSNKMEILKKTYEFKIDALEKTMDYYKSFLEEYYTQKLKDLKNNKEFEEGKKEYIVMQIKNNYENLSNRLNVSYNNKREELEYNFQIFLNNFYSN